MRHFSTVRLSILTPIAIGGGGLLSMSLIAHFLQDATLPLVSLSEHNMLNTTFTMQLMVLPVSFVAIAGMYFYDKENYKKFFRWGLTGENNDWKYYGPIISVALTLGTILLMSIGVSSQNGVMNETFFGLIPWVLVLSATNAWSEEIFSRFVIVAGLHRRVRPEVICLISAVMFGLPHFFGTPGGVFGVIATGFLGWLLAKSVIATKGLGWAWFIHFLQDVVIFGAGAMVIAGQNR